MYLGIEIGGTKLQLALGRGDGAIVEHRRAPVAIADGAEGILRQIETIGQELARVSSISAIGYGFGGPVDPKAGRTLKSHQVAGWNDFPLVDWTHRRFGVPVVLNNDCDAAALAESRFGAGRGAAVALYVTVGTGIGGGLVVDGKLYRPTRSIAAEIGHLRPGLDCIGPEATVETISAGPGIVHSVRRAIGAATDATGARLLDITGLEQLSHGDLARLTAKDVALAAGRGNRVAAEAFDRAVRTLGWAIAQAVTLVAPDVVIVGGGVSLAGEELFFRPIRHAIGQYVFPPLADAYRVFLAQLGEEVVVHGALAAAADAHRERDA